MWEKIRNKKKKNNGVGYPICNEHQDAEIHLQGEALKRVKRFTYLGSTLAEDGELDAEVTHRVQSGWKRVLECVRQENEREDQGEGVQNSGKTSTGVRGRDVGIGEGAGK